MFWRKWTDEMKMQMSLWNQGLDANAEDFGYGFALIPVDYKDIYLIAT